MSNPQVQLAVRYALDYDGINALVGGPAATPRRSCRSASWAPTAPIAPSSVTWAWPRRCLRRLASRTASTSICNTRPTSRAAASASTSSPRRSRLTWPRRTSTSTSSRARSTPEWQNYRDGNEGLGFWLWGPDYFDSNDYLAFLPEGIVGKRANWTNANSDPAIQSLRDQINVETDTAKRAALWQQAQDYLMQSGPFAVVIQPGHLHRHPLAHRQLRLQPRVAREPVRSDQVLMRYGGAACPRSSFGASCSCCRS